MSSSCVVAQPSYVGFISTIDAAALLFKACRQGHVHTTRRRIDSSDRTSLISSGHIFIYHQQKCNIQRWTDGLRWSPSRKLDGFLIYRELESTASRQLKKDSERTRSGTVSYDELRKTGLCGSLIRSYIFKTDGLIKKPITMPIGLSCMRLVSYYRPADVLAGRLQTPSSDANGELCGSCRKSGHTCKDRLDFARAWTGHRSGISRKWTSLSFRIAGQVLAASRRHSTWVLVP